MKNNLNKNVNHRLAAVAALSKRLVYRNIAEAGINITPEQWTVLYYLWQQDGLSIGELVRATRKDFANVTRIIEKLVAAGYVKKEKFAADKRSYHVFLLPLADTIKNDVENLHQKTTSASLIGISEEDKAFILMLLDRMEDNILNELKERE